MNRIFLFALFLALQTVSYATISYPVKLLTKELKKKDRRYKGEIWIRYPQIAGLKNQSAQRIANSTIRTAFRVEGSQGVDIEENMRYTDLAEVAYNGNHLLSIVGMLSQYAEGAAHPLASEHAVTLDTRTGKAYVWKDLVRVGATHFDSLVRATLDRRYENHGFTTLGDNPGFYLTKDSLVFILNNVVPYSAGTPEVGVAYSDIGQFIDAGSPLAAFLERKE